ncbi:MAG: hypothetical protein JXA00_01250 [Candidatus Thermoplasmatota archaeon]|nr:hypothetical protein [Candidatus Thermoplasmatota archaeon]
MKKGKKLWKKLQQKDDAVAGIIVAVLLVGLLTSVLAIVQTVYVPQWMQQKEAEHMNVVMDQFALLKFAIDSQALNENSDIALSASITLGSKEWPIFTSSRAYGSLEITEEGTAFFITKDEPTNPQLFSTSFGAVRYTSQNAYFLNKEYVYEAGALIASQTDGNVMAIVPNFHATYISAGTCNLEMMFTLINTKGIGEKTSIGGYGTYPIQTRFLTSNVYGPFTDVKAFSFPTEYQNAWEDFFISVFTKANLPANSYSVITTVEGYITVEFQNLDQVTMTVKSVDVEVQIAPGWIG